MIRARHARLIRIGIMAKCIPYKTSRTPDPIFGGFYITADYDRLRQIQMDWVTNNNNPLVVAAYERTKRWTSTRYI